MSVLVIRRVGSHFYDLMLESLSSFGKCGVSPTYPLLESVWSFICNLSRRLVSRSLSQTPRAGVSVRSAGGEFLLYAPCWNLSCYSSNGKSVLHALCCNQSRHLVSAEFLLHTRFWNQSGRFTNGETLLHAPVLFCVRSFVGFGVSLTHSVLEPVLSFW